VAYQRAFEAIGFAVCDEAEHESGFEKVAIFVIDERPTHVARQLPSGIWTSKLGQQVDIEHLLDSLNGSRYGRTAQVLRRRLATLTPL